MKDTHQIEKQKLELNTSIMAFSEGENVAEKVLELQSMRQKLKEFVHRYSAASSKKVKVLYDKKETISKFSDSDWMTFEVQFNSLFSGFIEKLYQNYPLMTKNEQRCCCLFLLGIKTGRIAVILDLAPNTVSKYRKSIYHKYFKSDGKRTLEDQLYDMI